MKNLKPKKYIFIDRDGVINQGKENGYIDRMQKLKFIPGALKALRQLKEAGYKPIIVSNQAGVSKGYYSMRELQAITRKLKKTVLQHGGKIEAVYYCPHRDEDHCACRKPKTGLFRRAKKRFGMTWSQTFMIGDSMVDIMAAQRLRCKTILVLTGREQFSRRRNWKAKPDVVKKSLLEAVEWVLRKEETFS